MKASEQGGEVVVGIDVGSAMKGYHPVALRGKSLVEITTNTDPAAIVRWCVENEAKIVAVDSPCEWRRYLQ